jgi:hypothetical protein
MLRSMSEFPNFYDDKIHSITTKRTNKRYRLPALDYDPKNKT